MYRMTSLDDLARQRIVAPLPLLTSSLNAAREFVRWWGAHRPWPANEPARLDGKR
jgi:hypothetical protein